MSFYGYWVAVGSASFWDSSDNFWDPSINFWESCPEILGTDQTDADFLCEATASSQDFLKNFEMKLFRSVG